MEYTIKKLAGLSGVSTRTLRYYDEIGLLKPARVASNGYRIYGQAQVDLLQQILFYRALEVPLEKIRRMLSDSSFDRRRALEGHLHALEVRKKQVETQIATVRHTLAAMKGERTMTDQEKFAGLRDRFLEENQRRYGPELEARYGKETVDAAQDKAAAMTGAQWQAQEELSARIAQLLRTAMETGDPGGPAAREACALHRQWLEWFWPAGLYTKQAHREIGELYVQDLRFRAYYEAVAPGCSVFFRDAIVRYCEEP